MKRSQLVNPKLANLQWRLTLFGAEMAGLAALVTVAIVLMALHLDLFTLLTIRWLQVPVLTLVIALALGAGLLSGYAYGNRLKRRLERLVDSILHYEWGDFGIGRPRLVTTRSVWWRIA